MTAAPKSPAVTREVERMARAIGKVAVSNGLSLSAAEVDSYVEETWQQWVPMAEAARLAASTPGAEGLRPMTEAPRGEYVLARYHQNTEERTEHWSGRWFVIRHEGKTASDYDLGWALYPGYGGVPDYCFDGWLPLPSGSPAAVERGEVAREALLEAIERNWNHGPDALADAILSALSRDGGKV